jgi:hypothetical protein
VAFTGHLTTKNYHNNIKPQIMKKAILTFGLFSLVMILTSFTTPENTNVTVNNNTTVEAAGSGSAGGNMKLDAAGSGSAGGNMKLDAAGSGSAGGNMKLDAAGSGSAGGNMKLD